MRNVFLVVAVFCGTLLGAVEIDWNRAEEVQTGVRLLKLELDQPRLMKVNLMRIDLTTPGLRFTGTGRDADWGKPMPDHEKHVIRTKRIRTRDFMLNARKKRKLDMIVAANSAPWSPWEKPFTHQYANPSGLGILEGEVICDAKTKAVFVVYLNGKVDIVPAVPKEDYPKIRVAASGFAIILKQGDLLEGGEI